MSSNRALVHVLARVGLTAEERASARALAATADWEQVAALAETLGAAGLVHRSLDRDLPDLAVPDRPRAALERAWRAALADNLARFLVAEEVVDALGARGIPAMPLKGALLVETHYDPGMRPMRDVDLLVPPGERAAAETVLTALGLRRVHTPGRAASEEAQAQRTYRRDRAKVDVHTALCDPARYPVDTAGVWRRSAGARWLGRPVQAPDPADHLAFVALHAALHGYLLPLTCLVDVAVLLRRNPDLAGPAAERARAWRAATAVHRSFALAHALCGAPLDPRVEAALRPGGLRRAWLRACLHRDRMPAFRWSRSLRAAQVATLLPLMDGGRARFLADYARRRLADLRAR
jgi:hypothetical protein